MSPVEFMEPQSAGFRMTEYVFSHLFERVEDSVSSGMNFSGNNI